MKWALVRFRERIFVFLGTVFGLMLRSLAPVTRPVYRTLISFNRALPDRATIWLDPFFSALGKTLFDMRAPVEEELKLVNGAHMRVDLSEKTQCLVYSKKMYEAGLTRFIVHTVKEGDTVIDVGANVGYFTMLAAAEVGASGHVIALEPEEKNFARLSSNVQLNRYGQVTLLRAAAGPTNGGTVTLHINPLNRGGNSVVPFSEYRSGDVAINIREAQRTYEPEILEQTVLLRSLDDIWQEAGSPFVVVMKVDVEGFESEVLRGADVLLRSGHVRHVLCELGNPATRNQILSLFDEYGYTPNILSFDGMAFPVSLDVNTARDILFSLK